MEKEEEEEEPFPHSPILSLCLPALDYYNYTELTDCHYFLSSFFSFMGVL